MQCPSEYKEGFFIYSCTLKKGHKGKHICRDEGDIIAAWKLTKKSV